ncbi:MAG: hypothetical protein FJ011_27510 [Chloroflexi bacterium]|nr:hypothetical protein [Chloroflexota bacterium]
MPVNLPAIKHAILAGVFAIGLTVAVNLGYGLAFLRWWGATPQEIMRQARAAAPYLILGLFLAAVGAILGALLTDARLGSRPLSALAAGAGLALLVITASVLQGALDPWLPPNAIMAVVGGWLGGWLVRRI